MKINQQLIEATQGKYSQIEIKVSPYRNKARVMPAQANVFSAPPTSNISVNTADELRSIAQKAPKGLKEKLEKLAQHANK